MASPRHILGMDKEIDKGLAAFVTTLQGGGAPSAPHAATRARRCNIRDGLILLSGFSPLQPSPMTVATVAKVSYKSLILLVGDPANREINREFCKIVVSSAPETLNSDAGTGC